MVLGVDPGIRNAGLVVIDETGKVLSRETIKNPKKWAFMRCLREVCVRAKKQMQGSVVVVEEVIWQGRKGMLPLAHVAGAVVGIALSMGCVVYLVTPGMKKEPNGDKKGGAKKPKSWSEHEWDAFLLAKRALKPDETMRRRCSG